MQRDKTSIEVRYLLTHVIRLLKRRVMTQLATPPLPTVGRAGHGGGPARSAVPVECGRFEEFLCVIVTDSDIYLVLSAEFQRFIASDRSK